MRIALDWQTFVWQPYGGIPRYFTELAQSLLNMEQQLRIFAPLYRNNYLQSLPRDVIYGRYIKCDPLKITRLFLFYNQFRARSEIAKWKPDIVHETYYARTGSAPQATPTVITVYDMIHELFAKDIRVMDNTAALKRIAIKRADHVICISENTKRDLIRLYGMPDNKISVVHLGFDQFTADDHSPSFDKPFLLYVGARPSYKNFSGLLKAVAASNRLREDFDIVVFGGSKLSSTELHLIHDLGLKEDQVQHKSGGDAMLGSLYSSAKAFVYPSLYEGFGIPPLEAMAHHCPVISSNTSSMPEVIGSAGEYFNPSDTDDMRSAIEAVVYSDSRIEELIDAGEKRLTSFSWNKCTEETLKVYGSLT